MIFSAHSLNRRLVAPTPTMKSGQSGSPAAHSGGHPKDCKASCQAQDGWLWDHLAYHGPPQAVKNEVSPILNPWWHRAWWDFEVFVALVLDKIGPKPDRLAQRKNEKPGFKPNMPMGVL